MLMMRDVVVHDRHLTTTDTSTDITHAIVVANLLMLIVGIALAILCGVHHNLAPSVFIRRDQGTSARGGNHLIAVETQNAEFAEGTQHLTLIARAEALCGILDDRNLIAIGNLHDAVYLIGHAIESHRYDGLGFLAGLCDSVNDRLLQQVGVHVPGIALRIDEYRRCAQIRNRMTRGTEREALDNDLIARSYATGNQGQMHGRCARSQGYDALVLPNKLFEILLKAIDVWSQRHHPVRVERLLDIFLFQSRLAHVSQAQINSLHHQILTVSFFKLVHCSPPD